MVFLVILLGLVVCLTRCWLGSGFWVRRLRLHRDLRISCDCECLVDEILLYALGVETTVFDLWNLLLFFFDSGSSHANVTVASVSLSGHGVAVAARGVLLSNGRGQLNKVSAASVKVTLRGVFGLDAEFSATDLFIETAVCQVISAEFNWGNGWMQWGKISLGRLMISSLKLQNKVCRLDSLWLGIYLAPLLEWTSTYQDVLGNLVTSVDTSGAINSFNLLDLDAVETDASMVLMHDCTVEADFTLVFTKSDTAIRLTRLSVNATSLTKGIGGLVITSTAVSVSQLFIVLRWEALSRVADLVEWLLKSCSSTQGTGTKVTLTLESVAVLLPLPAISPLTPLISAHIQPPTDLPFYDCDDAILQSYLGLGVQSASMEPDWRLTPFLGRVTCCEQSPESAVPNALIVSDNHFNLTVVGKPLVHVTDGTAALPLDFLLDAVCAFDAYRRNSHLVRFLHQVGIIARRVPSRGGASLSGVAAEITNLNVAVVNSTTHTPVIVAQVNVAGTLGTLAGDILALGPDIWPSPVSRDCVELVPLGMDRLQVAVVLGRPATVSVSRVVLLEVTDERMHGIKTALTHRLPRPVPTSNSFQPSKVRLVGLETRLDGDYHPISAPSTGPTAQVVGGPDFVSVVIREIQVRLRCAGLSLIGPKGPTPSLTVPLNSRPLRIVGCSDQHLNLADLHPDLLLGPVRVGPLRGQLRTSKLTLEAAFTVRNDTPLCVTLSFRRPDGAINLRMDGFSESPLPCLPETVTSVCAMWKGLHSDAVCFRECPKRCVNLVQLGLQLRISSDLLVVCADVVVVNLCRLPVDLQCMTLPAYELAIPPDVGAQYAQFLDSGRAIDFPTLNTLRLDGCSVCLPPDNELPPFYTHALFTSVNHIMVAVHWKLQKGCSFWGLLVCPRLVVINRTSFSIQVSQDQEWETLQTREAAQTQSLLVKLRLVGVEVEVNAGGAGCAAVSLIPGQLSCSLTVTEGDFRLLQVRTACHDPLPDIAFENQTRVQLHIRQVLPDQRDLFVLNPGSRKAWKTHTRKVESVGGRLRSHCVLIVAFEAASVSVGVTIDTGDLQDSYQVSLLNGFMLDVTTAIGDRLELTARLRGNQFGPRCSMWKHMLCRPVTAAPAIDDSPWISKLEVSLGTLRGFGSSMSSVQVQTDFVKVLLSGESLEVGTFKPSQASARWLRVTCPVAESVELDVEVDGAEVDFSIPHVTSALFSGLVSALAPAIAAVEAPVLPLTSLRATMHNTKIKGMVLRKTAFSWSAASGLDLPTEISSWLSGAS